MSSLELQGVGKVYRGGIRAVRDVNLTIEEGEFLVLVGPSGCGKSTLLRMIAGLEDVTEGVILMDGRQLNQAEPGERDIAMVFQNYALYPHMSVRANLGYGLKVRRTPRAQIRGRVAEVSRMLGLEELLDRKPSDLSGGQRQRVAMGRAIARQPSLYLMDEPLSNLDARLRVQMRGELSRLHQRLGVTTIYVTHDQVEAMTLGQRVAVMREGAVQQVGQPLSLYRDPANLYVATSIGSPSMNLLKAVAVEGGVQIGAHRLPTRLPAQLAPGRSFVLGMRPEALQDSRFAPAGAPQLPCDVLVTEELGVETHAVVALDVPRFELEELTNLSEEEEGSTLNADDGRALLTARLDPRSVIRAGRASTLSVDSSALYFFDESTGSNLAAAANQPIQARPSPTLAGAQQLEAS
jgi:multiple sugar transport system ATP-binding protein